MKSEIVLLTTGSHRQKLLICGLSHCLLISRGPTSTSSIAHRVLGRAELTIWGPIPTPGGGPLPPSPLSSLSLPSPPYLRSLPFHFLSFPPSPILRIPAPGSGERCQLPSEVWADWRSHSGNRFWCIFAFKSDSWLQHCY